MLYSRHWNIELITSKHEGLKKNHDTPHPLPQTYTMRSNKCTCPFPGSIKSMFMTCTYNGSLHTLMETQHGVPIKWIKVQKLQDNSPGLPWCGTGPVPYTSDTSWPAGNRASRWRCVRRVRTGCPSSGRSRPCTPPTTPGHSAEWLCWRQCHLDYKKEKKWLHQELIFTDWSLR